MKNINITIEYKGNNTPLEVAEVQKDNHIEWEIFLEGKHMFSLKCCDDEVSDVLELTPEYKDKNIDSDLVSLIADAIQNQQE